MQDPRNLSWNQFNQARKFPLLFGCHATSRDGHFTIPDDLLIGLYLSYGLGRGITDPGGFYIGEVTWWRSGLSLSVYYKPVDGGDGIKVAETTIEEPINGRTAALLGFNNRLFYGTVIFGQTAGLGEQAAGEWFFDPDAAPLDPFCIRPTVREISALYVQNGGKMTGPFYGDITLSAGQGIGLAVKSADSLLHCLDDPPSDGGTEVIISAEVDSDDGGSIKTINSVMPDASGNITLIGRSCLTITAQAEKATLVLDDTCAEPCCTCKELEPIRAKMDLLIRSIADLESHTQTLALQADFLSQSSASIR
jgi:hypothetical protein